MSSCPADPRRQPTAPYRLAHREDRRGFRGMAMQLTKHEYGALKDTHKADTETQLWVMRNKLATRELEVEHDHDCVKEVWTLTEAGKAAVAEYEASQRYPLWCVDFGDHLDEERYRGPFDEREPAEECIREWLEEDGHSPVVRRCRRLLASEAVGRAELGSRAEDFATTLDEDGVVPDNGNAWADWMDSVLDAKEGIRDALVDVIDRFVRTSVFVCEGDESAADICRERGRVVGDVLVGSDGHLTDAWLITAIGERIVAKRTLATLRDGVWAACAHGEGLCELSYRDWAKATPEQLAVIRPSSEPDEWTGSEHIPTGTYVLDDAGEVSIRAFDCDEHLVGLEAGEAWSSQGRTFRRLTIPEACARLLGPGYSVVEHEELKVWVRGDMWTGSGGPFRLTPGVARDILGEVAGWLAARESPPAIDQRLRHEGNRPIRALWADGPDSEARRAARGMAFISRDSEQYQYAWDKGYNACLHDHLEALEAHERAAQAPDPTHTPAVRRVVAWTATADEGVPSMDIDEAYLDAASCLVRDAAIRAVARRSISTGGFFARWPMARRKKLAAYLRRRDESKGYR